jgi:hypothetical protein
VSAGAERTLGTREEAIEKQTSGISLLFDIAAVVSGLERLIVDKVDILEIRCSHDNNIRQQEVTGF